MGGETGGGSGNKYVNPTADGYLTTMAVHEKGVRINLNESGVNWGVGERVWAVEADVPRAVQVTAREPAGDPLGVYHVGEKFKSRMLSVAYAVLQRIVGDSGSVRVYYRPDLAPGLLLVPQEDDPLLHSDYRERDSGGE